MPPDAARWTVRGREILSDPAVATRIVEDFTLNRAIRERALPWGGRLQFIADWQYGSNFVEIETSGAPPLDPGTVGGVQFNHLVLRNTRPEVYRFYPPSGGGAKEIDIPDCGRNFKARLPNMDVRDPTQVRLVILR